MPVTRLPGRDAIDHTPGRAQQWDDVDEDVRRWIDTAVSDLVGSIERVDAVYLHGSLALGSYYRPKSDVDLLVVVDGPITGEQRRRGAAVLLAAHDGRPTVGGLEVSAVRTEVVRRWDREPEFELHFSEKWADDVRAGGVGPRGADVDLIAIGAACRTTAITYLGPPPSTLIGAVPFGDFWRSIIDDFDWIVGGGIVESPVYGVLNICRTLRVSNEQAVAVHSKEAGAKWAIERVPTEHRQILEDALACYRSAAAIDGEHRRTHGHEWDPRPLRRFAAWAQGVVDDAARRLA